MAQRTPFYDLHLKLGGKMVDFAGWDMPIQYTTITAEHNAVRNAAGLFDISHMGQVFVWGADALAYLQKLTTNDISKAAPGRGIYAHLLNDAGGVIDDIFVYRLEDDKFLVIVNASRKEVDLQWMMKHKTNFSVDVMEAPFAAALALQGPKAVDILGRISDRVPSLGRHAIGEFSFGDYDALVARTGYTGEDGFEIFAPAGHLLQLWPELFHIGTEKGMVAAGLGARDTLRTEVAYPLYGHELDESHTPLEAGLSWVVKFDKGEFIGKDALLKQKSQGLKTHLVGFKVESGGVARPGGHIIVDGKQQGIVASGTFAPTLGYAIGIAYLPVSIAKTGAPLKILQGARELTATSVAMPFFKKPQPVRSS